MGGWPRLLGGGNARRRRRYHHTTTPKSTYEHRRTQRNTTPGVPALLLGKLLFGRSVGGPIGMAFGLFMALPTLLLRVVMAFSPASFMRFKQLSYIQLTFFSPIKSLFHQMVGGGGVGEAHSSVCGTRGPGAVRVVA